ncbi:MAG: sigma 54-interacting transcriptional regulator [Polyangia bacterium]
MLPDSRQGTARSGAERSGASALPEQCLALVVLWSASEPARAGEVALLRPEDLSWVLGSTHSGSARAERGARPEPMARPTQDPELGFFRQRPQGCPGTEDPSEARPLLCAGGARWRLELAAREDGLLVHNVGPCQLLVNGSAAHSAVIAQNDTLYLRDQLMVLCSRRPRTVAPLRAYPKERVPEFGQADRDGLVGESPSVWSLRERLAAHARTQSPLLVSGESRVARRTAARAIHSLSPLSDRPLLEGDCERLPGRLSALEDTALFLDEVEALPESLRAQLRSMLRLRSELQAGTVRSPSVSPGPLRAPLRLIGGTARPEELSEDLRHLFTRQIHVPSLNQIREDIPLLVRWLLGTQFEEEEIWGLRTSGDASPSADPLLIEQLVQHTYYEGSEELRELLERALVESLGDMVHPLRHEVLEAWASRAALRMRRSRAGKGGG